MRHANQEEEHILAMNSSRFGDWKARLHATIRQDDQHGDEAANIEGGEGTCGNDQGAAVRVLGGNVVLRC